MSSDEIQKAMLAKIRQITKDELYELAKAQQQTQQVISKLTKTNGGLSKTLLKKESRRKRRQSSKGTS
jgi:hypothetical protein